MYCDRKLILLHSTTMYIPVHKIAITIPIDKTLLYNTLKLFSSCKIHVHTYVHTYLRYLINYDGWITSYPSCTLGDN